MINRLTFEKNLPHCGSDAAVHHRYRLCQLMFMLLFLSAVSFVATAAVPFGSADIRVLGLQVDLDTRPDIAGLQTTMTAVKDIPTGVQAFVGDKEANRMRTRAKRAPWHA